MMADYLRVASGSWPRQEAWPAYDRDASLVCVHEAGHLCVDIALRLSPETGGLLAVAQGPHGEVRKFEGGRRIDKPGKEPDFGADPDDDPPDYFKRQCLDRAALFLAGFVAETEAAKVQLTGWPWPVLATHDLQCALAFLGLAFPHRIDGPLRAAWCQAQDTLRSEWPWVLRVAAVLEQQGRCDRAEAHMLRH